MLSEIPPPSRYGVIYRYTFIFIGPLEFVSKPVDYCRRREDKSHRNPTNFARKHVMFRNNLRRHNAKEMVLNREFTPKFDPEKFFLLRVLKYVY